MVRCVVPKLNKIKKFVPMVWFVTGEGAECLKIYEEGRDGKQPANALKFAIAIATVAIRLVYVQHIKKPHGLVVALLVSSIISTLYQICRDLFIDWGIFDGSWKHTSRKEKCTVYALAMFAMLLRTLWISKLLLKDDGNALGILPSVGLPLLELVRVFIWGYQRVRNEAVKTLSGTIL